MKSNQNSQAVKKGCGPQKGYGEKRCEIQGGGQEMAVMVVNGKNFNNDNSGEFLCRLVLAQNSPELLLLKFLPSQPFLGRHLGFHIFFHHSFIEGRILFLQLGCFGLDKYLQIVLLQ